MKARGFLALEICLSLVLLAAVLTLLAGTLWRANQAEKTLRLQRNTAALEQLALNSLLFGRTTMPPALTIRLRRTAAPAGYAWITIQPHETNVNWRLHGITLTALAPLHVLAKLKPPAHAKGGGQ